MSFNLSQDQKLVQKMIGTLSAGAIASFVTQPF